MQKETLHVRGPRSKINNNKPCYVLQDKNRSRYRFQTATKIKNFMLLKTLFGGKEVGANPLMIMPNLVIYIKEFSLLVLGTKNINLSFKRKRPIFPNLKI